MNANLLFLRDITPYIRMSNRLWRHLTVKVRYAFLMSLKIGFNFFLTTVWTKFESINELTHAHNVELCQFYSDLVQTFQILVKNHDSPKFYGVYHPERIESIILNAKQDLLIFDKLRFTLFHETTWPYHVLEVSSQYYVNFVIMICNILMLSFIFFGNLIMKHM